MENRDWMTLICEIGICIITAILLIVAVNQVLE